MYRLRHVMCCCCCCRQRKGLVPVLVVSSLVLLVLLIAIMRAAASARGDQRGVICFLSKLGVQIGGGCSSSRLPASASKAAVSKVLEELVEVTPRVKDIEPSIPSGSLLTPAGTAAPAGSVESGQQPTGAPGLRRSLLMLRAQ